MLNAMPGAMLQASGTQCVSDAQRNARTDGRTNGLTHDHSRHAESLNKRYAHRGAERIHPLNLGNQP